MDNSKFVLLRILRQMKELKTNQLKWLHRNAVYIVLRFLRTWIVLIYLIYVALVGFVYLMVSMHSPPSMVWLLDIEQWIIQSLFC